MHELPSALEMLRVYYAVEFVTPLLVALLVVSIIVFFYLGYYNGYKKALTYVWREGIPHTQKEYRNTYLRWKHKISD